MLRYTYFACLGSRCVTDQSVYSVLMMDSARKTKWTSLVTAKIKRCWVKNVKNFGGGGKHQQYGQSKLNVRKSSTGDGVIKGNSDDDLQLFYTNPALNVLTVCCYFAVNVFYPLSVTFMGLESYRISIYRLSRQSRVNNLWPCIGGQLQLQFNGQHSVATWPRPT